MAYFFFKKSKIVVDCFTTNLNASELFPIQESTNFFPDWWKNLPKFHSVPDNNGLEIQRPTMKGCDGFTALYQQGFMIPLWSDLIIETHQNGFRYNFADQELSKIGNHDYEQMSTEFLPYIQFKIQSPWYLKEKTGVKFLMTQPSYNHVRALLDWHMMPGVIDFKYQHASNINLLAPRGRRFEMFAGQPLAHLIPLSDLAVEIKTHVIKNDDLEGLKLLNNNYPFFNGAYRKMKKIIDSQESKSKCPFNKL
jgi:hypothetical protein